MDLSILLSLILIILCFLALSWFAGSGAPFVPTRYLKLQHILQAAGVKKGVEFYELGSGDGRVVIAAAKLGAQAYGVEQSWIRVWYSRWIAKKEGLKSAQFYHGDIFHRHYFPADVVYIYMLPKAVAQLEKQLKSELKPGAAVITQTYHFPHWKPVKKLDQFWIYRA